MKNYSLTFVYNIYTTRTKVFDHHEILHTNCIKVDLFKMEYVIKQKRYSIFDFRFVSYTSELLIFELSLQILILM